MKVVHFSFSDNRSGATRSALRLHHGLRSLGIDSKMLVKKKFSDDSSIIQAAATYEHPLSGIIENFYIQFQRTSLTNTCFSLGYSGVSCEREKIVREADVLIFHWVADFLSPIEMNNLMRLKKPIVWVCHDMRAFTGGCHYTAGCRQFTKACKICPQLKEDPFSVVEANFYDQLELFQHTPITIVAPSNWMAEAARTSTIFREARIQTIPYGIEADIFKPSNKKEARHNLKLNEESFVILLACSNAEEKRKGLDYLEALSYALLRKIPESLKNELSYKIQILFIGAKTNSLPHLAFSTKHLDFIENDYQLQEAYGAADVLLCLSKEDNLPNTVLEAMACGTPIVGFDVGGIKDLVMHNKNGFLVPLANLEALAEAILKILFDENLRADMGKYGRTLVERKFKLQAQARTHASLYSELLAQQGLKNNKREEKFLNQPLRIEKIMPHIFSIAKSIDRFIQVEKNSCTKQLQSLAARYEIHKNAEEVPVLTKSRRISIIEDTIQNLKKYYAKIKLQHSDYHFAIDAPRYLTNSKKQELRGWIFHRKGRPIEKIRFRIGDKSFNGFTGYLRPDVALYYDYKKGSYDSGIKVPIELHTGLNEIFMEVLTPENQWENIGVIKILCNPLIIDWFSSLKKGWCFLQQLVKEKRKAQRKHLVLAFNHYLHYKKWGGIGHLRHYAPKPIVYETFSNRGMVLKNKEKLPKISIVTPSYNQGNFLEQTIKSVLDQNYPNLEYVVIDGGSKDNSVEIIEKYRPLLSYAVSEPDDGQSDAIAKGFNNCSGKENDIMAYLNSDDLLLPGSLEFVMNYFQRHPEVDLIYGHRILIDENGQEVGRWFTPPHNNYNLSLLDYVPQETMFWRRRIYEKIGGIDPIFQFAMDWDFLLRAQESRAIIKRLPYFLGCFRVHEQQKTNLHIMTIGDQEVQQLRERAHGKITLDEKIAIVHFKNLLHSGCAQLLFSMGIRI